MRFFTRLITMVALLFIAATPLVVAQASRSADASATVVITPVLTLVKTVDLDFGSHFNSEGIVASSAPARWEGTTDQGNHLSVSFLLPTSLQRVGNGDAVPISFGNESAQAIHSLSSSPFNPTTGVADFGPIPAPGTFSIQLGTGSAASNRAAVDLTGRRPGTYVGVVTLTVTVL